MPTLDATELASRLRLIREERFGSQGGPELARRLNLPARTWHNYEQGVVIPGTVLIAFLLETDAEPAWLASGEGPRYRAIS